MANTPPTRKKKKEVTIYWIPITLWSVLKQKKRRQFSGGLESGGLTKSSASTEILVMGYFISEFE
jgi:hypothetical protein